MSVSTDSTGLLARQVYLTISSSMKRPGIFNLNFIEDTEYLKDLEWYYVGRSSGGLKRG